MRAVLDANVLVSALLSRSGAPAGIVAAWLAGEFELVASELLFAELERALGYDGVRARIRPVDAAAYLALLRERADVAPDPPAPLRRSSDPDDDYLLALAEAQRAMVVTGDAHLLEIADRFPIRAPRAFLDELQQPAND